MTETLTGRLLVATPALIDPNFYRTVVLVVESGEDGAVGLILNRPLPALGADVLPQWEPPLAEPGAVYSGGPVERATAIGLARRSGIEPSERWRDSRCDQRFGCRCSGG